MATGGNWEGLANQLRNFVGYTGTEWRWPYEPGAETDGHVIRRAKLFIHPLGNGVLGRPGRQGILVGGCAPAEGRAFLANKNGERFMERYVFPRGCANRRGTCVAAVIYNGGGKRRAEGNRAMAARYWIFSATAAESTERKNCRANMYHHVKEFGGPWTSLSGRMEVGPTFASCRT